MLPFAAILPTYCDRSSFFAAILHPSLRASCDPAEWSRTSDAKAFFSSYLRDKSHQHVTSLASAALGGLNWLFFPITARQKGDGTDNNTDDLQVIFERLALRDAMFCRPTRAGEFAGMGAADFVRNLFLGSFEEDRAVELYKELWLPMEAAAARQAGGAGGGMAEVLETMLDAYLKGKGRGGEGREGKDPHFSERFLGGPIYSRFKEHLAGAGEREDEVLRDLNAFALSHFGK